ncbi:MAG: IS200/IS605 family transposase [Muribaculaceae bacterium]|nr:IS200/IS605 family transposase [Muribaculaceae bacterium]
MSAVSSLFHIVINTLRREMTISDEASDQMYRYINSIVKSKNCRLLRINGIGNHIHLLVELSPTVALSDLVRDIKQGSSKWAKQNSSFSAFCGWGKEYGAFSCSVRDKDNIINYIINQREHHKVKTFEDEYKAMISNSDLEWNEYRLT